MGGHTVVAKLLLEFGTEDQKSRYLPRMATGQLRATMALTEPRGGSDLAHLTTNATRDEDSWVINGAKTWISNAHKADLIALLYRTDPDATTQNTALSILLIEKIDGACGGSPIADRRNSGTRALKAANCSLTTAVCRPTLYWVTNPGAGFNR
jgi:alkylation response protein AidB-like acyl-CoA dehydrogenase